MSGVCFSASIFAEKVTGVSGVNVSGRESLIFGQLISLICAETEKQKAKVSIVIKILCLINYLSPITIYKLI
jgi:type III secretory pathway component EscS